MTAGRHHDRFDISEAQYAAAMRKLEQRGRRIPPRFRDPVTLAWLLRTLCRWLRRAGTPLTGRRLAEALGLANTRELRAVIAYGRVVCGLREVVGIAGEGYTWGPADRTIYDTAAAQAREMGRCWLFLAAIYGRGRAEANMANLFLSFAATAEQRAALGLGAEACDELADLVDQGQMSMGGILDAILEFMTEHRAVYQRDLDRVARKHAATLVSDEALRRLQATVGRLVGDLRELTSPQKAIS
ncbi:MAG: hypothetical protein GX591_11950 [Planctomycetes bacterium]|nr:hypothetical protein [Planctomycetota bacterium]